MAPGDRLEVIYHVDSTLELVPPSLCVASAIPFDTLNAV